MTFYCMKLNFKQQQNSQYFIKIVIKLSFKPNVRQNYVCDANEYPVWTKCILVPSVYFYLFVVVFFNTIETSPSYYTLVCVMLKTSQLNKNTAFCSFCGFPLRFLHHSYHAYAWDRRCVLCCCRCRLRRCCCCCRCCFFEILD